MCKDFQNGKDKGALKNVIDHHNHGLRYWKASSKLKISISMLRTDFWKWKEHVLTTNLFWKLNPFVWDCSWKGYRGSHYRKNFENFYPIYLTSKGNCSSCSTCLLPLVTTGQMGVIRNEMAYEYSCVGPCIWGGSTLGVVERSMCYGLVPQCVVPATLWV